MRKIILTIVMGFSFFGLFAQTNNFKSVDVEEFAKLAKNIYFFEKMQKNAPPDNGRGVLKIKIRSRQNRSYGGRGVRRGC